MILSPVNCSNKICIVGLCPTTSTEFADWLTLTNKSIPIEETKEIKDRFGRLILKKELIVDENFEFTYAKDDYSTVTVKPAQSVSNYSYEQRLNEDKRKIRVLKIEFLSAFISDFRNIMRHDIYRSHQHMFPNWSINTGPEVEDIWGYCGIFSSK